MQLFKNIQNINLHFSSFMKIPIYNESRQKIGKISDLFVDYEEIFPTVIAIQYYKNMEYFYINWEDILSFDLKRIIIKDHSIIKKGLTFPKASKRKEVLSILANQFTGETIEYPALGKLLLDKQIVDTFGKKVVRVNDIQLIRAGQKLKVTHAEVGFKSMLRRLGISFFIPLLENIFSKKKGKYLSTIINWKFVHAIPNKNMNSKVQLSLSNKDLKSMHPADLADILEDIDTQGRNLIFKDLEPKLAAETLSEIEDDIKTSLIKNKSSHDVAQIISEMDTDDAADVLNDLPEIRQGEIISKIKDNEIQEEIQELLEYDEDSAGGLMTTDVFCIAPTMNRNEVIVQLKNEYDDFPILNEIFIIDKNEKLLGTCTLKELIIQKDDTIVNEIMEINDIKKLSPDVSWKDVAEYMSKYNLITVPITDKNNLLVGMISVDDILSRLLDA